MREIKYLFVLIVIIIVLIEIDWTANVVAEEKDRMPYWMLFVESTLATVALFLHYYRNHSNKPSKEQDDKGSDTTEVK